MVSNNSGAAEAANVAALGAALGEAEQLSVSFQRELSAEMKIAKQALSLIHDSVRSAIDAAHAAEDAVALRLAVNRAGALQPVINVSISDQHLKTLKKLERHLVRFTICVCLRLYVAMIYNPLPPTPNLKF